MEANEMEREASKVLCFLIEVEGGSWEPSWLRGYHPMVYGKSISRQKLDDLTAQLCSRLQTESIAGYSLECQIWWRDHQEADRKRVESEFYNKKRGDEREAALAKLTDYEKKLLGL